MGNILNPFRFGGSSVVLPLANVISSLNLTENARDSKLLNSGDATDITYSTNGALFNGTTSEVRLPYDNSLSFTTGGANLPFTWSFIVKFNAKSHLTMWMSKRLNRVYLFYWNTNNTVRLILYPSDNYFTPADDTIGSFNPTIGQEYHVVGIAGRIYIDGVDITTNRAIGAGYDNMSDSPYDTVIGNTDASTAQTLDGTMKFLKFWNVELTPEEVAELSKQEKAGTVLLPDTDFIVDDYPPLGAYSLRYLSSTYSGAVIRVVELGTNTEQDFTPKEIIDGTLETFCGANSGKVRTWYDQSGNANNMENATQSQQPFIVNSGVLNMEGGLPYLNQVGTEQQGLGKTFTFNGQGSVFAVFSSNSTSNGMTSSGAFGGGTFIWQNGSGSALGTVNRVNGVDLSPNTRDGAYDSGVINSFVIATTLGIDFDPWGDIRLFVYYIGTYTAPLRYREFIWYANDNDQTTNKVAIETNIDNYYGITTKKPIPKEDAVLVWEMDETSGSVAVDAHSVNDGTIVGATVNQTGKIGKSYSFDGTNDTVTGDLTVPTFDTGTPFSTSIWFKADTIPASEFPCLFSFKTAYASIPFIAYLVGSFGQAGYGTLTFGAKSNWLRLKTVGTITTGIWYHLVITFNGLNSGAKYTDYKCYLNGESLILTGTATGYNFGTNENAIGAQGGTANWFDGNLDQFTVFDEVLTQGQVNSLYNDANGKAYADWTETPRGNPITSTGGLQVWLDASDETTLFQDVAKTTLADTASDPVGCWADKSGNGFDHTQATAGYRPTLDLTTMNKPSLEFIRANESWMENLTDKNTRTWFAVWRNKLTSGIIAGYTYQNGYIYNSQQGTSYISGPGINYDDMDSHITPPINTNQLWSGAPCAWINANFIKEYRQTQTYIGTAEAGTYLGRRGGTPYATYIAGSLDGFIAEFITYNRLLTTSEIQEIEDYLNEKHSIGLSR